MPGFLRLHLLEYLRGRRISFAQTIHEIAVDAAIFLLERDGQRQDLLLGQLFEVFHDQLSRVFTDTRTGTLCASRLPAFGPSRSAPTHPCQFQDTSPPSAATRGASLSAPAKTERSGIEWAWRDESSIHWRAGSGTTTREVSAGAVDSGCGKHNASRIMWPSSPGIGPRARYPPRSGIRIRGAGN